jgi:hypothetical protein
VTTLNESSVFRSTPPQPYPRTATVFLDELDACGFEGEADGGEGGGARLTLGTLKAHDRPLCDPAVVRQFVARPIE